jgi:hypothetical protein
VAKHYNSAEEEMANDPTNLSYRYSQPNDIGALMAFAVLASIFVIAYEAKEISGALDLPTTIASQYMPDIYISLIRFAIGVAGGFCGFIIGSRLGDRYFGIQWAFIYFDAVYLGIFLRNRSMFYDWNHSSITALLPIILSAMLATVGMILSSRIYRSQGLIEQVEAEDPDTTTDLTYEEAQEPRPHRGATVKLMGILGLLLPFLAIAAGNLGDSIIMIFITPAAMLMSPILGVLAWVKGTNDLRNMDRGLINASGRRATNLGRILGMVTCAIWMGIFVAIFFAHPIP